MSISKQSLCDAALGKLGIGRGESLTGFSGVTMSDSLQELEAMMAEWQGKGWDLNYQFATPTNSGDDIVPLPSQDSMIDLRWKSAVTSNLAVRIGELFSIQPTPTAATEASNGLIQLGIFFVKVPNKNTTADGVSTGYFIKGSGNLARKW